MWRGTPRSIDPAASPIDERFSKWRDALSHGELPAVVFNATNVESGYPVLIGTTEIPQHGNAIQIGGGDGQYGDADIAVATAARLSATFSYISPVATAVCDGSPCPKAPHYSPDVDDGGYFDNPGVWSAVKWLEAVLADRPGRFNKVVILELWAFPFDKAPDPKKVNQLFAPATTLLNVRTASQLIRGDTEIRLLQDKYGAQVDVKEVTLKSSLPDGPLSWMLSKHQKEQIKSEWDKASDPNTDEMKTLEGIYGHSP